MIKAGDILKVKNTRVHGYPAGTKFVALTDESDYNPGIIMVHNGGQWPVEYFDVVKKDFWQRFKYLFLGE